MQGMQQTKPSENPSEEKEKNEMTPPTVSPEERKAGFEKAIELAPKAVEQMEMVLKACNAKNLKARKRPPKKPGAS